MSINAIEILEERRRTGRPVTYRSAEWWDMTWSNHFRWQEDHYPPPAATLYEVTPPSGKVPE